MDVVDDQKKRNEVVVEEGQLVIAAVEEKAVPTAMAPAVVHVVMV